MPLSLAARAATYLRIFAQAHKQGMLHLSSKEVSAFSGIGAAQVRRDMAELGVRGRRGLGYTSTELVEEIGEVLQRRGSHPLAIVGCGQLGIAIARSPLFSTYGCSLEAAFDRNPHVIGTSVGPVEVLPASRISNVCREKAVEVAVIAVPAESAQEIATLLVDGGVRIILNYSEALIRVPLEVRVCLMSPAEDLICALYLQSSL